MVRWPLVVLLFAALLPVGGCATTVDNRHMQRVAPAQLPHFEDDLDLAGLEEALVQQQRHPATFNLRLGKDRYTSRHLRQSVDHLLQLTRATRVCLTTARSTAASKRCRSRFNATLRRDFIVYRLKPRAEFTAYYTPTVRAARHPDQEFRYPIYRKPYSEGLRTLSRRAIDFEQVLAGKGLELFYTRSLFDNYLLHEEGGGRLALTDGGSVYLSYAANNGRPFRLLHEVMIEQALLKQDRSRHAQRRLIEQGDARALDVLAKLPHYVFFREDDAGARGSTGAVITPGRSLASDPRYYGKGLVMFVTAERPPLPTAGVDLESNPPITKKVSLRRFFVDQDIGPSILGPTRFDLFFGEGDDALFLANNLHEFGQVYALVLAPSRRD